MTRCLCGSYNFNVLQTRRLKNAKYSNGRLLESDNAKGRNLEVLCSECGARYNEDFTPFIGYFYIDGINWGWSETFPIGVEIVTQSKDEITQEMMRRMKCK